MNSPSTSPLPPNPQFVRDTWTSLDGTWDFAPDRSAAWSTPEDVRWSTSIRVPFPPESSLSSIGDTTFQRVVWYRRTFEVPSEWSGLRYRIRFGAVDYCAKVWIDGRFVGTHEGGHTPFSFDITDALDAAGPTHTVVVRAEDDPVELDKPRGKQDWLQDPHGIWYPRTTGIWQPVWLEGVPPDHIASVRITPDLRSWSFQFAFELHAASPGGSLRIKLRLDDQTVAAQTISVSAAGVSTQEPSPRVSLECGIGLFDPGIDNARARYLWSPDHPVLFDIELEYAPAEGSAEGSAKGTPDRVRTYAGLRSIEARGGQVYLNDRPLFLRMVLDQGYWMDGHLSAPNADALKRDVELTLALGFNGARKHQKFEDPRYLYWADRLGLLVWEELPSAYRFSTTSVRRCANEWVEAIGRDYNHPCIIGWVPFNESWGVPDLPHDDRHRHFVHALYHLAKALDSTRLVIGNDGWEHVVSDLLTVHDYTRSPDEIASRYGDPEARVRIARDVHPGGRDLATVDMPQSAISGAAQLPLVLSEFGGIQYAHGSGGWGYDRAEDPEDLLRKYGTLVAAATGAGIAGFCYTQLTDTFQEQNGLLYMDRTPKAEPGRIAQATRGGYQRR